MGKAGPGRGLGALLDPETLKRLSSHSTSTSQPVPAKESVSPPAVPPKPEIGQQTTSFERPIVSAPEGASVRPESRPTPVQEGNTPAPTAQPVRYQKQSRYPRQTTRSLIKRFRRAAQYLVVERQRIETRLQRINDALGTYGTTKRQ